MQILIDTREQKPFAFMDPIYQPITTSSQGLQIGDYSLAGLQDKIAIERKSLDDLVQCLCRERERFERELVRGAGLDVFAVVVEADWQALAKGQYRSRMNPHAACQSVAAFTARYRLPFIFAGSRKGAEYVVWSILRQYLESARKRFEAIVRAQANPAMDRRKECA